METEHFDNIESETADPGSAVERTGNILLVQEKMKSIREASSRIADMQSWGDLIVDDRRIIEKLRADIKREAEFVSKYIIDQFSLIRTELTNSKEIKSASGVVYKSDDIMKLITQARLSAIQGIIPDLNNITRTNNLRQRVSELVNLILDLKKQV